MTKKLLYVTVVAALAIVAVIAFALPASAEQRTFKVQLSDGSVITVTVQAACVPMDQVPGLPGTPVEDLTPPGVCDSDGGGGHPPPAPPRPARICPLPACATATAAAAIHRPPRLLPPRPRPRPATPAAATIPAPASTTPRGAAATIRPRRDPRAAMVIARVTRARPSRPARTAQATTLNLRIRVSRRSTTTRS